MNRHVAITRCRLLLGIDDDASIQHLCVPIDDDDGIEFQHAHPGKRTNQCRNLQQDALQCLLLGLACHPIRSNRRQRRMHEIDGELLIERRQHQGARGAGLRRMRAGTQRNDRSEYAIDGNADCERARAIAIDVPANDHARGRRPALTRWSLEMDGRPSLRQRVARPKTA